ncbi:Hypothetical_protein [Hexamita inflata]|uniref:Hypothetical_protein n=1 Tax=Hexamita inflata TaxID=28002 RepID=A0AA86R7R0_9EUKA|nr:Hypothetical protein HINF_LOCUS59825 [Hexamita inflata]
MTCSYYHDIYYYTQPDCQQECSIQCSYDFYALEYCCPLYNRTGFWWISLIFVALFMTGVCITFCQIQSRRKRLMNMNANQQQVIQIRAQPLFQPAVQPQQQQNMFYQPQQVLNQPPQYQQMPVMPIMPQNSLVTMPAVM